MNRFVFRSKSATKQTKQDQSISDTHVEKVHEASEIVKNSDSIIMWIGDNVDLTFLGNKFGYHIVMFSSENIFVIPFAKALVLSSVETITECINEAVNIACEYGIPVVWLNRSPESNTRNWCSKTHISNDIHPLLFWEELCHLTK